MNGRFAAGTGVSEERTRAELERLLTRYGCSSFGTGWDMETQSAHITFRHGDARILVGLSMPKPADFACTETGRRRRSREAMEAAYMGERRRLWRALLLIVKAKLEAVASGISTLEREFLADMVLPNGRTLGEWAVPQLEAIQRGRLQLPEHSS